MTRAALTPLLALAWILSGCGGESASSLQVRPAATVPAATAGGAVQTAAAASDGPAATPSAAPLIVARDNAFSPTELRVPAGREVRLTLRNEGQALHDWQLVRVTNPDGSPIKTALLAAGASGTVTFTVAEPGTYAFYCEVHPVEMRGTLIVSDG